MGDREKRLSVKQPGEGSLRGAYRRSAPRLAVIDTQSVACIPVRGPRGYGAAKKVLGRKRVALVDADGTWLAVAVVPANTCRTGTAWTR